MNIYEDVSNLHGEDDIYEHVPDDLTEENIYEQVPESSTRLPYTPPSGDEDTYYELWSD